MSCALTSGFTLPCRDGVGGVKTIYITELANFASATIASGVVTALTLDTGKKFWTYELTEETAEVTEKATVSVENGSIFYDQSISLQLQKQQASTRNELRLLAQNNCLVIELDRNGKYFIYGYENGVKVESIDATTGKSMGDFNGYKLTLKGKESNPAYEVSSNIIAGLLTESVS